MAGQTSAGSEIPPPAGHDGAKNRPASGRIDQSRGSVPIWWSKIQRAVLT
jgi:hypothetical protein